MDNQPKTIDALREDVVTAAVELFEGDRRAADAWLSQPLRAIGNEAPLVYMDSPEKIQAVKDVVGRLEHGVWT
ncbi:antitoxin Xre/MbcA/ParS toxin-binding domain-containing protein [Marinobacter sp. M1N3S26]|uniref:antitoxin Xre/MbcA/ParS toxin-binding domain-containing protein n=1 Tax=Marinobacter sp. M1N3S26 TaxID=3382299 RepID=UPI00387B67FE